MYNTKINYKALAIISKQFELIKMFNKKYIFNLLKVSQMHKCSQVIHSIFVVLLSQMPNRQCYTSLLCLGAVLAHSSGVGIHQAFIVEHVLLTMLNKIAT